MKFGFPLFIRFLFKKFQALMFLFFVFLGFLQSASADIQITDSHGKYTFSEPPKRVVALNWTLAEQMLTLGVAPVGIADIEGLHKSSKLAIPEQIVDVGARLSPNLKKIKALNPDIILIGYSQRTLLRPLSSISTVIYFKSFGKRYNNAEKSRERFLEMAKLFDRQDRAKKILREIDDSIDVMKLDLERVFTNGERPTIQFSVPQSDAERSRSLPLWVFGNNSMPFYAAQKLGLEVLTPISHDQFGMSHIRKNDLVSLQEEYSSLCYGYFPAYQEQVFKYEHPASDCLFELDYQNAFGGVMSILYLSESIYKQLKNYKSKS